ncbi:MAG: hypothetical protein RL071_4609 [Pseudomonadota bacterium]
MLERPHLGLTLPFFNEEAVVDAVLDELRAWLSAEPRAVRVALVDNGSRDQTRARLAAAAGPAGALGQSALQLVALDQNAGYGGGILTGLRALSDAHAPRALGWAWGDGQVEIGVCSALLDAVEGGAALAKVRRTQRQDGALRRLTTRCWSAWARGMGAQSADLNGCPKVFRAELLRGLPLRSTGWFLDAELVRACEERALPVVERPAVMRPRRGGASKVRPTTAITLGLQIAAHRAGWRP